MPRSKLRIYTTLSKNKTGPQTTGSGVVAKATRLGSLLKFVPIRQRNDAANEAVDTLWALEKRLSERMQVDEKTPAMMDCAREEYEKREGE